MVSVLKVVGASVLFLFGGAATMSGDVAYIDFSSLGVSYGGSNQAVGVWTESETTGPFIYSYQGNPFTQVSPPYTTSDFVTFSFTLSSPLPLNSSFTPLSGEFLIDPDLLAWNASDGVQTLSGASGGTLDLEVGTQNGLINNWIAQGTYNPVDPNLGDEFRFIGTALPPIVPPFTSPEPSTFFMVLCATFLLWGTGTQLRVRCKQWSVFRFVRTKPPAQSRCGSAVVD